MIDRALLVLVWALVLTIGYLVIESRRLVQAPARVVAHLCAPAPTTSGGTWVAARPLPVNTRVDRADLVPKGNPAPAEPTDLVGRYTACVVAAGQSVSTKHLRAAPEFPAVPGQTPYVVSLQGQPVLAAVVNAGSIVDVWSDGKPLFWEVRVAAVMCDQKAPPECVGVVELAVTDAETLARSDAKKTLLLIRKTRGEVQP